MSYIYTIFQRTTSSTERQEKETHFSFAKVRNFINGFNDRQAYFTLLRQRGGALFLCFVCKGYLLIRPEEVDIEEVGIIKKKNRKWIFFFVISISCEIIILKNNEATELLTF